MVVLQGDLLGMLWVWVCCGGCGGFLDLLIY